MTRCARLRAPNKSEGFNMTERFMRVWSSAVFVVYLWSAAWLCLHALPLGVLAFLLWQGTEKIERWFRVAETRS